MATVSPSDPKRTLRGKLGRMVYSLQPNGTVTVRSVGVQSAPSTKGERKGQRRMKLAREYVKGVLGEPAIKEVYAAEARNRHMRTCDLVMSDFLKDPVIASVDATNYRGGVDDWLLVLTGDDFKVIRLQVVVRNVSGERLEEGFGVPAQGSTARVWIYSAQNELPTGQSLLIEITAVDRCGHSTTMRVIHSI